MLKVLYQKVVQDVGHFVLLVVDDEWDGHHSLVYLTLCALVPR